jgi:4-amino-4-deoxy-L-arabinose transferase-like glycosyltransferase
MRPFLRTVLAVILAFIALLILHAPLLRLPWFWDEAGYYIPAALDFYHAGRLVPASTQAIGHTPLVMVYLGLVWHVLGYSVWAGRAALTLIAAATVVALYALARRVAGREAAISSALLLAVSPLFFAQTTLAHLDLAVALFTTLAVLFLIEDRFWAFALAASLAVLSKETAVVLLPVAWLYVRQLRGLTDSRSNLLRTCAALAAPLVPLAAWTLYYHHATGYWTGNRDYLSYNVYSTLSVARVFLSLLRRGYELFVSGFNWVLTAGALWGWWRVRRNSKLERRNSDAGSRNPCPVSRVPSPVFLAAGLMAAYLLLLSLVGGAILPRYLLPVLPLFYLVMVAWVRCLPPIPARLVLSVAAVCFVSAWFINPPYPFPFEDNLAYADFVRLHQQAARYLETRPAEARILTAWPASDELTKPALGYVERPLRVGAVPGFALQDFSGVRLESFELLYLYSRRWEPPGNWVERFPAWLRWQERYFDYHPQVAADALATRLRLRPLWQADRRGQWVRIYAVVP